MPYLEPDPSDPSMLVGTVVECSHAELREMAAAFASELAQIGHDAQRICRLFRHASYAGPHLAWRVLGEAEIVRLTDEAVRFWSRCRVVVQDRSASPPGGLLSIGTGKEEDRRKRT